MMNEVDLIGSLRRSEVLKHTCPSSINFLMYRAKLETMPSKYPPLLNPFPPDGAPSAASKFLPLPKRHHGLQQTCSAPHHFPGRTDALRHPPRLPLAHALPDDTPRPMVSRVSVISMVPWVSTMLERVLDEMDDRCWPLFFDAQGV